ncbi:MAG: SusD/RagB family nutrient-binding outer membrane lipoprotein [Massilibacteroides sp.]|nr:SusD/RagB family nutrient-binding outer membrane lipoprotein [Massilibacteroides sp.]
MKKTLSILFSALLLSACGDFDEINLNPDTPTKVTPDFLAAQIILKSTDAMNNRSAKWLFDDSWLMKSTSFTEHMEWYMYNKFERGDYKEYYYLTDARKMIEMAENDEAIPAGEYKAYLALNHFMRGLVFYKATMAMGDIPCSEAIQGEGNGLFSPIYDPQEVVFETILSDLTKASSLFGEATKLKGDVVFNGNVDLWQRATNSMILRVLNMLSKKTTVGTYHVKSLFEETAQKALMRDENESYRRVYDASKSAQWYPFYYEIQNFWPYPVMTSFFVDMLKGLNDYRLFYYAEPAEALSDNLENTFNAYSGVTPTLEYGQIQAEFTQGLHSSINKRYYRLAQGEPIKIIAYSEIQFVLAEAALRGWKTPQSAKEHYENGVRAAMMSTVENTPDEYRHGVVIDEAYITNYLKGVAAFNESKGLEQIMTQKYLASFVQLPFNSYYDYRRTGYPELPIDPATNMNEEKTQLPVRWMYPSLEYSQNREHIETAIQRQFGGTDTPNDVMWLLK